MGSIAGWLNDQNLGEELQTTYGISDDYTHISNAGLIRVLVRMGYVNQDSVKVQRILERMEAKAAV